MYNQQQANLNSSALNASQTPPAGKKAGAKRKNTQQGIDVNNAPGRPTKQATPFMQPNNGMMPGQHFQVGFKDCLIHSNLF